MLNLRREFCQQLLNWNPEQSYLESQEETIQLALGADVYGVSLRWVVKMVMYQDARRIISSELTDKEKRKDIYTLISIMHEHHDSNIVISREEKLEEYGHFAHLNENSYS